MQQRAYRYRLSVGLRLEKLVEDHYRIAPTGDRLQVDQELELPATSFMQVLTHLARFEELAERLRSELAPAVDPQAK